MTTPPPGTRVRRIAVPAALTDQDAADFIAFARLRNEIYAEISGNHDEDSTPEEMLANYVPNPDEERRAWLVDLDGRTVGRAVTILPSEESSRVAYAWPTWRSTSCARHGGRGWARSRWRNSRPTPWPADARCYRSGPSTPKRPGSG